MVPTPLADLLGKGQILRNSVVEASRAQIDQILALAPALDRQTRRVAVMGSFSVGKSTFLNALMGRALLPVHSNRSTGVITEISYGEQPRATVHRKHGAPLTIALEDIGPYIRLETTAGGATPPRDVLAIKLELELPLLREGLTIVDTPGLLDSEAMTERTFAELKQCDLAVMVLAADRILGEPERLAAERVSALLGGNLVFVLNRLGLIDAEERGDVLEWTRTGIDGLKLVPAPLTRLHVVDALTALHDRGAGRATAELNAFELWLQQTMLGDAGRQAVERARRAQLHGQALELQRLVKEQVLAARAAVETIEYSERKAHAQLLEEHDEQMAAVRKRVLKIGQGNFDPREQLRAHAHEKGYRTNFAEPVAAFSAQVDAEVKQSLGKLYATITPPRFVPSYNVSITSAIDNSGAASAGAGMAGIILGTILLPGIGTVIGGMLGAGVGNSISESRRDEENRKRLAAAVNQLAPELERQFRAHIVAVEHYVESRAKQLAPKHIPSAQLKRACAETDALVAVVAWCEALLAATQDEFPTGIEAEHGAKK